MLLLLFIGAWDDRFHVQPRIKFGSQILAAVLVVYMGDTSLYSLGNLLGFGPIWLGPVADIFFVVAIVLLINALNLIDGLDGLAGGLGVVVLMFLLAAVYDFSRFFLPLLVLAGALTGFLVFNFRHPWRDRANVFLGDAGSMALGLSLGWFCIQIAGTQDVSLKPISVAWFLALPIMDTCAQFARRVRQGRHPFDSDHNHFHHHFITAGFSPRMAVLSILILVCAGSVFGYVGVLAGLPEYVLGWSWIILLFGHIFMSLRPKRFRRVLNSVVMRRKGS